MNETLGSLRCLAPLPTGRPCNQPVVVLDCHTLRPLCLTHAHFLTGDQRALVTKVLDIVGRGLGGLDPH